MARTKRKIMKNHKEQGAMESRAVLYEVDGNSVAPAFDASQLYDKAGQYEETALRASAHERSPWVANYKGNKIVTIKDHYATNIEVTLHKNEFRKEQKITMTYGELCDLVTAFQFKDHLYRTKHNNPGKTPLKIGKVKTVKVKK